MSSFPDASTTNVSLSKDEVNQIYNNLSPFYDLVSPEGFDGAFRNKSIEMLGVSNGDKVLEIGFGTGRSIVELAKAVMPNGQVHGVDLSENMLDETMGRLRDEIEKGDLPQDTLSHVHLVCQDATSLPYEDDSFDLLFMSFTLELFDKNDIKKVARECYRVLKRMPFILSFFD